MSGSSEDEILRDAARMQAGQARQWPFTKMLGETEDDLFQIAWIGAWQATRRYDPAKGATYRTWAMNGARWALQHYIRDETTTRRGVSRVKYERRLSDHKRLPPLSLDAPASTQDEWHTLGELVQGAEDPADPVSERMTIKHLFDRLSRREARLLWGYIVADFTQVELGHAEGISQKHVSRMILGALGRLRARAVTMAQLSA